MPRGRRNAPTRLSETRRDDNQLQIRVPIWVSRTVQLRMTEIPRILTLLKGARCGEMTNTERPEALSI